MRLRTGTHVLDVTTDPGGAAVEIDGTRHAASLLGLGPTTHTAIGAQARDVHLLVDGMPRRALVVRHGDRVVVVVDGRTWTFETGDAASGSTDARGGSGLVVTPMPGRVTDVRVAVDAIVEPGAVVIVLEAMKMETTLTAEIGGRVTRVHATVGAMVDAGAVLVEIAPD